jgi:hypothetical protein
MIFDCEGPPVGVDGPASSCNDIDEWRAEAVGVDGPAFSCDGIDEGRVEGKLAFTESIASSIRPERMLT